MPPSSHRPAHDGPDPECVQGYGERGAGVGGRAAPAVRCPARRWTLATHSPASRGPAPCDRGPGARRPTIRTRVPRWFHPVTPGPERVGLSGARMGLPDRRCGDSRDSAQRQRERERRRSGSGAGRDGTPVAGPVRAGLRLAPGRCAIAASGSVLVGGSPVLVLRLTLAASARSPAGSPAHRCRQSAAARTLARRLLTRDRSSGWPASPGAALRPRPGRRDGGDPGAEPARRLAAAGGSSRVAEPRTRRAARAEVIVVDDASAEPGSSRHLGGGARAKSSRP